MAITLTIQGADAKEIFQQVSGFVIQGLAAGRDPGDKSEPKTEKKVKKESAAPAPMGEPVGETPAQLPAAADPTPEPAAVEQAEKGEELTIEKVRAVLTELSQNGKKAQVKQLLTKFSVERVTELKPDQFAAVMAEAEKLQ